MKNLAKRLANHVAEPETLKSMKSITELNLNDENIFIDPKNTYLGLQANFKLKAFLNEGDISEYEYKNSHEPANRYYRSALDYIQIKFLISS